MGGFFFEWDASQAFLACKSSIPGMLVPHSCENHEIDVSQPGTRAHGTASKVEVQYSLFLTSQVRDYASKGQAPLV